MVPNARVTAFTISELLRENQQEEGGGGNYPFLHPDLGWKFNHKCFYFIEGVRWSSFANSLQLADITLVFNNGQVLNSTSLDLRANYIQPQIFIRNSKTNNFLYTYFKNIYFRNLKMASVRALTYIIVFNGGLKNEHIMEILLTTLSKVFACIPLELLVTFYSLRKIP